MKRLLVGFILLVLLIIPLHARAGVPFDTVKGHVNAVLKVLRDPALQGDAKEEAKQEKIEAIADEMFDYVALSRLTLGRNWKKFNSDQKKEFIQLYRSILEKAYMDRILSYTDEEVTFGKETMLSEKKSRSPNPHHYKVLGDPDFLPGVSEGR